MFQGFQAGGQSAGEQNDLALLGVQPAFQELAETLKAVRRGAVRSVLLSGPAGSGKTLVLGRFLEHCRTGARGVRVLSATGDEWEAQFPLAGYSQLVSAAAPPQAGSAAEALSSDGGAFVTPERIAQHAATFMAQLEAMQAQGTVVVAVDDIHRFDVESMHLILYCMRRLRGKRILFLLTGDPELSQSLPSGVSAFLTGHQVTGIHLSPLSAAGVQTLARERYGLDLSATAAQVIVENSGGWPRPVTELLEEMPPETWLSWFPALPPSARVRVRVDGLLSRASDELVSVAEAAAVLRGEGDLADLRRLSGVDDVLPALDEGHKVGLLRLSAEEWDPSVRFRETGFAGAVYESILPSRRLELHRLAAEGAEGEGARLQHLVAATLGADETLAARLEAFASEQAEIGAWQEASRALFSAASLSSSLKERNSRLLRAVDALVGSGNLVQAQLWAAEIGAMPPSPLRSSVLGYLSTVLGNNHSAETQLTMAWRTINRQQDPAAAAQIAQRMVVHGVASWNGGTVTQWAERAMSLTTPGSPAAVESEAIYGLGLYAQGRLADAERSYAAALSRVSENAQKQRVQIGAGWLALRLDDAESAQVHFEAAAPTEIRGGSLRISLWAEAWLARTHLILGQWDAAAATISRASVRLEASRMPLIRPLLYWTAAELWSVRGDWDRARFYVSQASVQPGTYLAMQVPAILARARFHESRGDYEGSLAVLRPLAELDPWTDHRVSFWPWQGAYVNALVMTDQAEKADAFLRVFEAVRRERPVASDLARIAWARGRVLAALGDSEGAQERFESALEHLSGLNRPYLRAQVSFAYGQSMRRAGKRRLATSVLRGARDLYDSLGAVAYVERCDRELKAAGIDSGGGAETMGSARASAAYARETHQLTPQEKAVADLVAGGMTNKEVARSLFIAEKTVQYHLTRVYGKLGIRSRSELAAHFRASD